jgi:hypothetical protein
MLYFAGIVSAERGWHHLYEVMVVKRIIRVGVCAKWEALRCGFIQRDEGRKVKYDRMIYSSPTV